MCVICVKSEFSAAVVEQIVVTRGPIGHREKAAAEKAAADKLAAEKAAADKLAAEKAAAEKAAADKLAAEKAAVSEKNRRYRQNLKEQAKTNPAARRKIEDRRIRKNELARLAYAESKGQETGKELVNASA